MTAHVVMIAHVDDLTDAELRAVGYRATHHTRPLFELFCDLHEWRETDRNRCPYCEGEPCPYEWD